MSHFISQALLRNKVNKNTIEIIQKKKKKKDEDRDEKMKTERRDEYTSEE